MNETSLYQEHNTKLKDTASKDTTALIPVSSVAIKVYPNPVVNSSSVIEYDLPSAETCSIYVINSVGQVMASANLGQVQEGKHILTPGQLGLGISGLPNGVYTIKILTSQGNAYTRFLVLK